MNKIFIPLVALVFAMATFSPALARVIDERNFGQWTVLAYDNNKYD